MLVVFLLVVLLLPLSVQAEDLGELSANPFNPASTANPFAAGSSFKPDGPNNPFSLYGSPFSNQSATNPYATDAPSEGCCLETAKELISVADSIRSR
jgi:hypothetical protein